MIELTTYLDIERSLAGRLVGQWRAQAAQVHANITEAIDAKDWPAARAAAQQVDLETIANANREWIKYTLYAAAKFGAAMANGTGRYALTVGAYEKMLGRMADSVALYCANAGNTRVHTAALQSIANAETPVQKLDTGDTPSYVHDFTTFGAEGDRALQLISSLHTSRLSAWGFTAEAEVLGITEYQLIAVLDKRTSEFCQMINGRRFKVADARDKLQDVLAATNPDDLRELQPWPDQDAASIADFESMTDDELSNLGLMVPPFHPYCRTLLARIGRSYRLSRPGEETGQVVSVDTEDDTPTSPDAINQQADNQDGVVDLMPQADASPDEPVDEQTFAEYGIQATPEQVKYWNDYVGVTPGLLFSLLANVDPQDIFDQLVEVDAEIDPAAAEITLQADGPLAGLDSKVSTQTVFDPITGTLYHDFTEFQQASPAQAEAFLRTLYSGMAEGADAMDAADLTVQVPEDTAADHAAAGFVPDQGDWDRFREYALRELTPDGEFDEVVDALDEEELATVVTLLSSANAEAAVALAALPFEVEGGTVADDLFAGEAWRMNLDLNDPDARARFAQYFP